MELGFRDEGLLFVDPDTNDQREALVGQIPGLCPGIRVWGLGFGVENLEFRVKGFGFWVWSLGFRFERLGPRVEF